MLLFISFFAFMLVALLPGDAVLTIMAATETLDTKVAETLRQQYQLDQPLLLRYLRWLGNVLRGDFGVSLLSKLPVMDAIGRRLPVTLILTAGAILISLLLGIPTGILAGIRPNSLLDRLLSALAAIGNAAPNFWLGMILGTVFAVHLKWLPAFGYKSPIEHGPWIMAKHMLLPWIALSTARTVEVVRQVRSGMVETMSQDYIRTARSKGLSQSVIVFRHALRNILIPVVTGTGLAVGRLLSGAVVVEQVFLLPGLGTLAVDSVLLRDFPLTQGMVLLAGVVTILANLLADMCYGVLDPRIRYD